MEPGEHMSGNEDAWGGIGVRFYSGYRGAETPRALIIAGAEMRIESVLERKRIRMGGAGGGCELFRCRAGGRDWIIHRYDDGRVTVEPAKSSR